MQIIWLIKIRQINKQCRLAVCTAAQSLMQNRGCSTAVCWRCQKVKPPLPAARSPPNKSHLRFLFFLHLILCCTWTCAMSHAVFVTCVYFEIQTHRHAAQASLMDVHHLFWARQWLDGGMTKAGRVVISHLSGLRELGHVVSTCPILLENRLDMHWCRIIQSFVLTNRRFKLMSMTHEPVKSAIYFRNLFIKYVGVTSDMNLRL